jgi:hypothetical protein
VYVTAMGGRPATATVTGLLSAFFNSSEGYNHRYISLSYELSKGTTAHVDNCTMMLSEINAGAAAAPIKNSFNTSSHRRTERTRVAPSPTTRPTPANATTGRS